MGNNKRNADDIKQRRDDAEFDELELDNVYEEMGADFAVGSSMNSYRRAETERYEEANNVARSSGYGMAWVAFIFAAASWFVWPVLLGATAGLIGIIAYMQGARGLAAAAMVIGLGAMLFNLLVAPIY